MIENIYSITLHMIVKNEDKFVGFALASVLPYVSHAIIYDTGSSDKTVEIIEKEIVKVREINPNLVTIFKKVTVSKVSEINQLRNEQLQKTQTEWFLLVDGDEIWPQKQLIKLFELIKSLSIQKIAVVNKTRNCVGDVWHYAGNSLGKYRLLGKIGHLNIRLMRKKDYQIKGIYPNEAYFINGKSINQQENLLAFSSAWYLHTSHLYRSSSSQKTAGRRYPIYSYGLSLKTDELPEVMQNTAWEKRNIYYILKAIFYDIGRTILRR